MNYLAYAGGSAGDDNNFPGDDILTGDGAEYRKGELEKMKWW